MKSRFLGNGADTTGHSQFKLNWFEPEIRSSKPGTRNPKPEARNPIFETRNPKSETRNRRPETRNPTPGAARDRVSVRHALPPAPRNAQVLPENRPRNPKPGIRDPRPRTRNPKPATPPSWVAYDLLRGGLVSWGVWCSGFALTRLKNAGRRYCSRCSCICARDLSTIPQSGINPHFSVP